MNGPTYQAGLLAEEVSSRLQAGESVSAIRKEVFGKQGRFNVLQREIGSLGPEQRKQEADALTAIRTAIETLLTADLEKRNIEPLDVTLPPLHTQSGSLHPITLMADRMVRIFTSLGFEMGDGPEIVSPEANFTTLNIGPEHPARDPHDTFYLDADHLLRTQTTAVQVAEIRKRREQGRLPMRVVLPGKTYRRESDATHSPMFHQFEGILVDRQATMSDLKGTLDYFVKELFGAAVETRLRPHYFPFTEPSAELDIRWRDGSGPWLEMLGCGMIHPNVLHQAGLDPEVWRGWAFGMGIERFVIVDAGVSDLRLLFENNGRFLSQFPL